MVLLVKLVQILRLAHLTKLVQILRLARDRLIKHVQVVRLAYRHTHARKRAPDVTH